MGILQQWTIRTSGNGIKMMKQSTQEDELDLSSQTRQRMPFVPYRNFSFLCFPACLQAGLFAWTYVSKKACSLGNIHLQFPPHWRFTVNGRELKAAVWAEFISSEHFFLSFSNEISHKNSGIPQLPLFSASYSFPTPHSYQLPWPPLFLWTFLIFLGDVLSLVNQTQELALMC